MPTKLPSLSPTLILDMTVARESIEQAATVSSQDAVPLCPPSWWLLVPSMTRSQTRHTSPSPPLVMESSSSVRFFLKEVDGSFLATAATNDSMGHGITPSAGTTRTPLPIMLALLMVPCWVSVIVVPPLHEPHS